MTHWTFVVKFLHLSCTSRSTHSQVVLSIRPVEVWRPLLDENITLISSEEKIKNQQKGDFLKNIFWFHGSDACFCFNNTERRWKTYFYTANQILGGSSEVTLPSSADSENRVFISSDTETWTQDLLNVPRNSHSPRYSSLLNLQDRRLKEQFTQKEKGGKVSFQIHFGSSGLQETLSLLDELYGAAVVLFFQSPAASDVQENDVTPFYNCSISMQVK